MSEINFSVGLAFSRADAIAIASICSPDSAIGIFCWTKHVLAAAEKSRGLNCFISIEDKQLHLVGYLTEFSLGLLMSPKDCVSRSPGFESILGIYPN